MPVDRTHAARTSRSTSRRTRCSRTTRPGRAPSTRTCRTRRPRAGEAEPLPRQAARRGGRRGVGTVPRRPDAAALGRQARGRAVPVPAVVRDREEEQGLHRGGASSGFPTIRVAVEFRHKTLDGGAQRRGDALASWKSGTCRTSRRHAAGLRLEPAADRGGDGGRPGDGALPRPEHRGVEHQERDGVGALPLRLLRRPSSRSGSRGSRASPSRPARRTC